MTQQTIYIGGSETVTVPATESIAVSNFGGGVAKIFYWVVAANVPDDWQYQQSIENEEVVLGPFSVAQLVRIDAGTSKVLFDIGASPATGTPASTLGGLTASQFLRSDADDDFTGSNLNLDNSSVLNGRDTGDTARAIAQVDGSDILQIGADALPTNINSDGTLTHNTIESIYTNGNLISGSRNVFINPWQELWSRGETVNVTVSDTYVSDRHVIIFDGTADIDVEKVALPAAMKIGNKWCENGLRVTVNTNSGNTYLRLCQRVEYVTQITDTAAVLNTFIQGSGTLTVPVRAKQDFGTGGSADVVTDFVTDLSVTSSMQELASGVTIPSVSGKTIVDTDSFLAIEYDLINLVSTDYVIIPYHQFEPGSIISFPEYRQRETEISHAQRYAFLNEAGNAFSRFGSGFWSSTTRAFVSSNLPVKLRSLPTLSFSDPSTFLLAAQTSNLAVTAITSTQESLYSLTMRVDVAAGATAGEGTQLFANNTTSAYYLADSELYE